VGNKTIDIADDEFSSNPVQISTDDETNTINVGFAVTKMIDNSSITYDTTSGKIKSNGGTTINTIDGAITLTIKGQALDNNPIGVDSDGPTKTISLGFDVNKVIDQTTIVQDNTTGKIKAQVGEQSIDLDGPDTLTAKIGTCAFKSHVEFEFELNTTSSSYDRDDAGVNKLSVVNAKNSTILTNVDIDYQCDITGIELPVYYVKNPDDNTLDI
jgi:hypothetical protein